jgi:cytochrome c-type biogenesis protein
MVAYCAGLGVPFLGLALLLERALPALRALSRYRRAIDWGSAGILAAMGVLLMTNNLTWITQRLTELLPRGLLSPLGL